MDERTRRVGENEALFRTVNEQSQSLNQVFAPITDAFVITCECGRLDCLGQIKVSAGAYTEVREDPRRFLVLPGHEVPETEEVVREGDGYVVIEKNPGAPAELAHEADPRS